METGVETGIEAVLLQGEYTAEDSIELSSVDGTIMSSLNAAEDSDRQQW